MSDRKEAATRILGRLDDMGRHLRVLANSDDPVQVTAAQSHLEDWIDSQERLIVVSGRDARLVMRGGWCRYKHPNTGKVCGVFVDDHGTLLLHEYMP